MFIRQSPADALAEFFAAGSKDSNDFKYGIELEHFIINQNTGFNINYNEPGGAEEIFNTIEADFAERLEEQGRVIALANDLYGVSLEPGGQIECSVNAAKDLVEIKNRYAHFRAMIDPILAKNNAVLVNAAYLPKSVLNDIMLIPKSRYDCMDRHFLTSGSMGRYMMRATCACHTTIDFRDESDFIEKYRIAYILSPVISYITSTIIAFEGKPYDKRGLRYTIWQNTDHDRTGLVPTTFDKDFGFKKYAEYILQQTAILIPQNNVYIPSAKKVSDILENDPENEALYELYMSLVFPDVRLRQYIEIRSADSMPFEQAIGYLAFIKGIFTDFDALKALISSWQLSDPKSEIEKAYHCLLQDAAPKMYGLGIENIKQALFKLARANLVADELAYLMVFEHKTNGF